MRTICYAALLFGCSMMARGGESHGEFAAASAFGQIGPKQLLRLNQGEVLIAVNSSMSFPRGISTQACYLLPQPPDAAAHLLRTWNPTQHAELEVYQYRTFHSSADARFETFALDGKSAPARQLVAAMRKPSELQLSKGEVNGSSAAAQKTESVRDFWTSVLQTRFAAFQNGGVAMLPACESGGVTFSIQAEWKNLFAEEPKIVARFGDLLKAFESGKDVSVFYWSVSKVDKLAAVDMGAIIAQNAGDHWQLVDATFYVSSGYLTSLACYELWPVTINGKSQTLVWQTDLVSAPGLAGGFGIKRKIASLLIQSDINATVRILRDEAASGR